MLGETDDELSIRFCVDEMVSVAGAMDTAAAVDTKGLLSSCVGNICKGEHAVIVIKMISFVN